MMENLQQLVYRIIQPLILLLIRLKITPNMITTLGFLINLLAAIVLIYGAYHYPKGDLSALGWAGGLILLAGFLDIVDGRLAREGNMVSKFGALYDSVLDRYSELVMFLGICFFLIARNYFFSSLLAFIALIGSMMVSYVRARSEAIGVECKTGLMQRPERILIISISMIITGIAGAVSGGNQKLYITGTSIPVAETIIIFIIPIAVVAVLANITAYRRLMHSKKELEKK